MMLLVVAVLIAGCATNSGGPCDGWSAIPMKQQTADYLAKNDKDAADGVLSHNEHGEKTCRWRPPKG